MQIEYIYAALGFEIRDFRLETVNAIVVFNSALPDLDNCGLPFWCVSLSCLV